MSHQPPPRPRLRWTFAGLAVAAALAAALALWARIWLFWAWLAAINAVTFALWGLDKAGAKVGRGRVPEAALHAFALLGGTGGALLGMVAFEHKTASRTFRWTLFGIVALQLAVLGAVLYHVRGAAG